MLIKESTLRRIIRQELKREIRLNEGPVGQKLAALALAAGLTTGVYQMTQSKNVSDASTIQKIFRYIGNPDGELGQHVKASTKNTLSILDRQHDGEMINFKYFMQFANGGKNIKKIGKNKFKIKPNSFLERFYHDVVMGPEFSEDLSQGMSKTVKQVNKYLASDSQLKSKFELQIDKFLENMGSNESKDDPEVVQMIKNSFARCIHFVFADKATTFVDENMSQDEV